MANQEPANNQAEPQPTEPQGGEPATGSEPAGTEPQGGNSANGAAQGQEAKYTDADVDGMIQSRLARERAKIEREVREQLAKEANDAQTQAQKLENMTELQRAQYEAKQLKAKNEALEAERDLSRQMAIARRELSDAGISMGDDLLSMFVAADAEKTGAAIDRIKELWPKAVNEAVQKELKRTTPPASQGGSQTSFGASFAKQYTKTMNGGNK